MSQKVIDFSQSPEILFIEQLILSPHPILCLSSFLYVAVCGMPGMCPLCGYTVSCILLLSCLARNTSGIAVM